jgi:hypothetical protein
MAKRVVAQLCSFLAQVQKTEGQRAIHAIFPMSFAPLSIGLFRNESKDRWPVIPDRVIKSALRPQSSAIRDPPSTFYPQFSVLSHPP